MKWIGITSVVVERENAIEDRFDYVFVSDEIGVTYCSYDYEVAKAAGSDHGIVTAELSLRQ
jgi:endonuclease/exonuclease/phosphatase family metal-dependent hydrolase